VDVDGVPTASVVVEVVVTHEGPDSDCCATNTSDTVWIGVKVWLAGRNYWGSDHVRSGLLTAFASVPRN